MFTGWNLMGSLKSLVLSIMSVKEVLIILLLQIIYSQAITLSSSAKEQLVIDDDAIRKLSEIFDIPNLKRTRDVRADIFMSVNTTAGDMAHATKKVTSANEAFTRQKIVADQKNLPEPPQYMINLFNTIADRNGIMRIPNPYHANLIKSFPNKDLSGEGRLHFDLSSVHFGQIILQAELHLELTASYNLTPSDQPSVLINASVGVQDHLFIEIYLIENVFPLRKRLIGKKSLLIEAGNICQTSNLSEVVTIRPAVLQWINRPHHNFGLQVSVSSSVKDAAGNVVNFEVKKEASRVPVLILFMDDGRPDRNPKYRIKSWAKQNEFLKSRLSRLGQADLYDSYTAADQLQSSLPIRPSSSQDLDSQDIFRIFPLHSSRVKRSGKSGKDQINQRKKANSVKKFRRRGQQKGLRGSCRRHQLYVSFEEIGWSSWIISPKGFQAFHCRGDCHFPIGQDSKPSNHATVISIINHLKLHKNVAAPCCVPEKLYSISLLYFDNEQNVILKQYDDMVAQSCACR